MLQSFTCLILDLGMPWLLFPLPFWAQALPQFLPPPSIPDSETPSSPSPGCCSSCPWGLSPCLLLLPGSSVQMVPVLVII